MHPETQDLISRLRNYTESEKPVTQFMLNNFQQIQRYMFCFWDVGYGYKFGLTEHGDWVDLKHWSYINYNP